MNTTSTLLNIKRIQGALKLLATLQLTSYLWPQQALVTDGARFDFIIVGAGTAGSVIANRLTEDKSISVLLIEAGGDPPLESVIGSLYPYLKDTDVDWSTQTVNDGYSLQFHKNGRADIMSGKMLGGTSSINVMGYTRGNKRDFDDWAEITGDDMWSYQNVLPYLKKSEKLLDQTILNSPDRIYHGTHGRIAVNKNHDEEILKYLKAFSQAGQETVTDINENTPLGYTEFPFTLAHGVRQSTAYGFLTIKRDNLFVLRNTMASRIIFDKHKNAIGVEAILENNTTVQFKANKEVIVSCGTIRSPQLLMLSGIGPKKQLQRHDIKVISDLPVGQGLQDHVFVWMAHVTGKPYSTKPFDASKFPYPIFLGFAALNKSQTYPDYETFQYVLNHPMQILKHCSFYLTYLDEICQPLYENSIGREILFGVVSLINPKSRGEIVLQSRNIRQQPLIYAGYYSNKQDLEDHAAYLEHFSRVYDTEVFRSLDAELLVPSACGCNDLPIGRDFWRCYAMCMMGTGYHHSSSCSMGSVVDSRLKVYGVNKLRVADASIMPKISGANPYAATIMIGERAADIIKEDNNLRNCKSYLCT